MRQSTFTRAGSNGRLTIACPSKGRLAEPTLRLCADAGLSFETTERALLVPCANAPVDLLLVRAHDVPEYVQDGVVDLGITGANLVAETQADVVTVAELGFAHCALHAAVPEDAPQSSLGELDGLRVATAYPVSTRSCLAAHGVVVRQRDRFAFGTPADGAGQVAMAGGHAAAGQDEILQGRQISVERIQLVLEVIDVGIEDGGMSWNAQLATEIE